MPDPIARERLNKKMLDRWENEGGAIAADTLPAPDTRPMSQAEGHGKKPTSRRNDATIAPANPAKRRKPSRK